MGKAKKEHRKRVQARNRRIEQAKKSFRNKFQEELLKHIELEKQKATENQPPVENLNAEISEQPIGKEDNL